MIIQVSAQTDLNRVTFTYRLSGVWFTWKVSGHVLLRLTSISGQFHTAVAGGVFLG